VQEAAKAIGGHKFGLHFLLTEWEQVVDAWQLENWEAYRDVARLGRKTRLPEAQRTVLWSIFERVRAGLKTRQLITHAEMFSSLAAVLSKSKNAVFDFAVVDEAQDISVVHLRFFAALGGRRANALFFAGDLGQRIFQQPFSWKSLGVDIHGRSRTLRVNYRTSHQIRMQADRLLGPVVTDVDGNSEDRSDTVSVFNGPLPTIHTLRSESDETKTVSNWIAERAKAGVLPHEFGVFVRSEAQLDRARAAVKEARLAFKILDEHFETSSQGPRAFSFARSDACLLPFTLFSSAIGEFFLVTIDCRPAESFPRVRVALAPLETWRLGAEPLTDAVTPSLICARRNPALSWHSHEIPLITKVGTWISRNDGDQPYRF
jgi:hypothetical protein